MIKDKIKYAGEDALHKLIECYYSEDTFYMRDIKFLEEDDNILISNQDIINYISNNLLGKYKLQVDYIIRQVGDIQFEDIELKIVRND